MNNNNSLTIDKLYRIISSITSVDVLMEEGFYFGNSLRVTFPKPTQFPSDDYIEECREVDKKVKKMLDYVEDKYMKILDDKISGEDVYKYKDVRNYIYDSLLKLDVIFKELDMYETYHEYVRINGIVEYDKLYNKIQDHQSQEKLQEVADIFSNTYKMYDVQIKYSNDYYRDKDKTHYYYILSDSPVPIYNDLYIILGGILSKNTNYEYVDY